MDKKDMDKLFDFLGMHFKNSGKPKDLKLKYAWCLVLEPYSFDEVMKAAAQCLREKNFFPDVTDITQKCSVPAFTPPMGEADQRAREDWEWMREFIKHWKEDGAHGQ